MGHKHNLGDSNAGDRHSTQPSERKWLKIGMEIMQISIPLSFHAFVDSPSLFPNALIQFQLNGGVAKAFVCEILTWWIVLYALSKTVSSTFHAQVTLSRVKIDFATFQ